MFWSPGAGHFYIPFLHSTYSSPLFPRVFASSNTVASLARSGPHSKRRGTPATQAGSSSDDGHRRPAVAAAWHGLARSLRLHVAASRGANPCAALRLHARL